MNIKKTSSKVLFIFITVMLITAMFFAGCMSSNEAIPVEGAMEPSRDSGTYVTEVAEEAVEQEASAEDKGFEEVPTDESASGEIQYGDTDVSGNRKVIKNAYIGMEIEGGSFEKVMFELTALAEQSGGFIASSESYSDSEGNMTSGNITMRVPSNKYNSILEKVKEMGTIESVSSSGQDITQEYVDLESRLRNYEAQEKVLLELLEQSKRVSDMLEIQRELSNVRGEIEVIKGRMTYLDDLVSFSTISVYFHEPEPITVAGWGFLEALKRGLRGAVNVFNGITMFLIASSPVWILIGVVLIIVWQSIRAMNRRRARKEQK
jgi:hypothetical protein